MAAADDRDDVNFPVVRHGFDRAQVKRHLQELTERVEASEAARVEAQAATAELQGELEIARREIAALTERLDAVSKPVDEESAARLLAVAKSQASEVTVRAKAAAEQTWASAEQASVALRERYRTMLTELDKQHTELNATHGALLKSAKAQAEKLTTEAQRRREAIDKEAELDRIRIDREFSESMAAKRDALQRELEAAREASVKEVDERLRAADEEVQRRLDTVTEQVRRLTAVRDEVSGRLQQTKQLLEKSAALLEPVEEEEKDTVERKVPSTGDDTVPTQREKLQSPAKR